MVYHKYLHEYQALTNLPCDKNVTKLIILQNSYLEQETTVYYLTKNYTIRVKCINLNTR